MTQLIIPVDMVVKKLDIKHGGRKFKLNFAVDESNTQIIHTSFMISENSSMEYNFKDEIDLWVQDNIKSVTFDTMPYVGHPIFSKKDWHQLIAIFENDNDALLFKMRWL